MEEKQQEASTGSIGVITVPKGKVLKDFRFICKKHGDITNASIALKTDYTKPSGEHIISPNIYCIACLNEYLEQLQKDGYFPPVAIVPIVGRADEVKEEKKIETQNDFDFKSAD